MRPFACDMVLIEDGRILLIKRGREPFKGQWAVPGGRIDEGESAEQCASREMREETGLDIRIKALIGIYSDPGRDPRGIIAAAYLVERAGGQLESGDDAAQALWFPLDGIPPLMSDHPRIVADALAMLGEKG